MGPLTTFDIKSLEGETLPLSSRRKVLSELTSHEHTYPKLSSELHISEPFRNDTFIKPLV